MSSRVQERARGQEGRGRTKKLGQLRTVGHGPPALVLPRCVGRPLRVRYLVWGGLSDGGERIKSGQGVTSAWAGGRGRVKWVPGCMYLVHLGLWSPAPF